MSRPPQRLGRVAICYAILITSTLIALFGLGQVIMWTIAKLAA